jgi:acyl-CoA thioesterase
VYDPVETTALLGADRWSRLLGVQVGEVTTESLTLTLELTEEHLNFLDGGHGGVLFSLAEAAASVAAAQRGSDPVLLDGHLALTAGGRAGDIFSAKVSDVNVGRSIGVLRVTVRRSDGRLVGELTATMRFAG